MNRIREAIDNLREALETLEPYQDANCAAPEEGCLFKTLNGSLVYVVNIDNDGDGHCVVLQGGHGRAGLAGEQAGESYWVDAHGFFRCIEPGVASVMSLARKLSVRLDEDQKA